MSSFANLSSVVDRQGDTTAWPSDQSWDPPPAGMICTGSLSDTRLHSQNSARPRQAWEWSDSRMILASTPRYVTEGAELDTKPGVLNADALGGSALGLRHYGGEGLISAVSSMLASPSMAGSGSAVESTPSTAWPRPLNAGQLRQAGGIESTDSSCFATPPLMSIHAGNAAGSNIDAGLGMCYNHSNQSQTLGMDHQRRMQDILKKGLYTGSGDVGSGRLGLNLGGRTYFSAEDMGTGFHFPGMVMGTRFRPNSPSFHVPLCQAEGCKANLSVAKHYHRRHKVCEYHSKAATVAISGNTQRFCQQCSRFHALAEFDEGKRSCRKRLADHNRRRRKPQPASAGLLRDSAAHGTFTSTEKSTSKLFENESTELVAGINPSARAQSEKQDVLASKEGIRKVNQNINSSPMEKQSPRRLSPMKLAPPVSLGIQDGGYGPEVPCDQASSLSARVQEKSGEEVGYVNKGHAHTPYLLNGPSLSLSSNNVTSTQLGSFGAGDTSPNSTYQKSPVDVSGAAPTTSSLELSMPWLRGHHCGSISRTELHPQDSVIRLSGDNNSLPYKISITTASNGRRNARGKYFNERGRLLAEGMQNMHPRVSERMQQDLHTAGEMENWTLQGAVPAEGQSVLSLLETSDFAASRKDSRDYP